MVISTLFCLFIHMYVGTSVRGLVGSYVLAWGKALAWRLWLGALDLRRLPGGPALKVLVWESWHGGPGLEALPWKSWL